MRSQPLIELVERPEDGKAYFITVLGKFQADLAIVVADSEGTEMEGPCHSCPDPVDHGDPARTVNERHLIGKIIDRRLEYTPITGIAGIV